MSNAIAILRARGFIDNITSPELEKAAEKPLAFYWGTDPTADCLHLGHFVGLMTLRWLEKCGHKAYVLVGGATGMIGDPSFKANERSLLDNETLEKNLAGIKSCLKNILKNPHFVNNYDWYKNFCVIDFLRDVGKQFRVGQMLGKEAVRSRIDSDSGLSFTEFSYPLLQGYDFYHLSKEHGVSLQIGGSDQWGNITAGTEYARKTAGTQLFGLCHPLLTDSSGKKLGKTESGALWLSADKCSPYDFYQYLLRVQDADVIKFMYLLTMLEIDEIEDYKARLSAGQLAPNEAQRRLAEEVTLLVHGQEGLEAAKAATTAARSTELSAASLEAVASSMPNCELSREEVVGQKVIDLLALSGMAPSKGEARRLIRNGGVSINNVKVTEENADVASEQLIENKLLLLATGKKNKMLIRLK